MPLPVQLKAVVGELEIAGDGLCSYINRKTGEVVGFSDETRQAVEDDDPPTAGWQLEDWQSCKRVLDDTDFITLPSKYDMHDYAIMERFCLSQDESLRDRLLDAIRGRGAFRRFKDLVHSAGIEQDWYRHRTAALKRIAADFLEAHGIPFIDEDATP